jgi:hypothetical protein
MPLRISYRKIPISRHIERLGSRISPGKSLQEVPGALKLDHHAATDQYEVRKFTRTSGNAKRFRGVQLDGASLLGGDQ